MSESREIWFQIQRLYQSDANLKSPEIKKIDLNDEDTAEDIRSKLKTQFVLEDEGLVIKVRNERGSLVPINKRLESKSRDSPYTLDVVRRHQNIEPMSRSVELECYNSTVKAKLIDIINRIEKLESSCPQLQTKREEKIHAELEDIDKKLSFLNKRITEADDANWSGMFRKNPLW